MEEALAGYDFDARFHLDCGKCYFITQAMFGYIIPHSGCVSGSQLVKLKIGSPQSFSGIELRVSIQAPPDTSQLLWSAAKSDENQRVESELVAFKTLSSSGKITFT